MNDYYRSFNKVVIKKGEEVLEKELKKHRKKTHKRINIEIPLSLDLDIDQILLDLKHEYPNLTKREVVIKIIEKGVIEWNNQ